MYNETERQRFLREEEEALLNGSPETILGSIQKAYPKIPESVFKQDILPRLTDPFNPEFLAFYESYVAELTLPLQVVSESGDEILFEVPPLVQAPRTTVSYGHGVTAEHFFVHLKRMEDLGGRGRNYEIRRFMGAMTQYPDYRDAVVKPIQAILERYGQTLTLPTPPDEAPTGGQPAAGHDDAFSEEYED